VVMQLLREIAAKRPGLLTHVGLGTFVDPRHGGGRMNEAARDELVDLMEIDGRTVLRYRPFPINVALIRGYVLHIAVVPLLAVALVYFHFSTVRRIGLSGRHEASALPGRQAFRAHLASMAIVFVSMAEAAASPTAYRPGIG